MKGFINNRDFIKSLTFLKISGPIFISFAFFYLAKHWSDGSHQLIFFNSRQTPLSSSKTPSPISLSPNLNKTFDLNSLINNTTQTQPLFDPTLPSIPPTSHPKPLPPPPHERFGIVDENGTMVDDFEVGDFDPGVVDNWGSDIEAEVVEDGCGGSRVVVKKFGLCTDSMRECIPCLDNTKAIRRFNSTEKGERFERHCPEEGNGLNWLVPAPKGYRAPIPWPRSRDEFSPTHLLQLSPNPLSSSKTPSTISLSPNLNKTFDINSLINNTTQTQPLSDPTLPLIPPTSHPKPLSSPPHERFGIVDNNETMADDFEVRDFNLGVVDNWGNDIEAEVVEDGCGGSRVVAKKFGLCTDSMREYIPCLDNTEAIRRFNSTEKGERFERHCPEEGNSLNCLVPAPRGYRAPIPWPRSRDEAFGVKVTVISTSPSKKKEATEHLEADSFLVSHDVDQMENESLIFISLAFFYLAKHWSDGSHQLIFSNSRQTLLSSSKTPSTISLSPNLNKTFDINSLINNTTQTQPLSDPTLPLIPPTSHPKPLSSPLHERFGIVDNNKTMADDFEVRDFNPGVVDNWGNDIEAEVVEDGCGGSRVVAKKFGLCTDSMREYIPCFDNTEAIRRFNSTEKGERFERHCPKEGNGLNCLVPAPRGYRAPIPWPRSRDEDWRMKGFINNGDFIKSSTFLKISSLVFISLAFFYLAKHWSDGSHQLIFFNSRQTPLSSFKTPSPISLSPNLNKTFDLNSLINNTTQTQPLSDPTLPSIPPTSHPTPLPLPPHERFGIVDENGTMANDFEVRDFNSGVMDNWGSDIEAEVVEDGCGGSRVVVKKFGLFTDSIREYIPCLDNTEAIRLFNSTEKGERFERHCPEEGKGLNCLVPTPKGYRNPNPPVQKS
ncbi:unnamed protein product [Camellia sinensis]